jgi:hypothetical protein
MVKPFIYLLLTLIEGLLPSSSLSSSWARILIRGRVQAEGWHDGGFRVRLAQLDNLAAHTYTLCILFFAREENRYG